LVGKRVKCPACANQFTATVAGDEPVAAQVDEEEEAPRPRRRRPAEDEDDREEDDQDEAAEEEEDDEDEERRRKKRRRRKAVKAAARSEVAAPAIILMVIGGIAFLLQSLNLVLILTGNGQVLLPGQLLGQPNQQGPAPFGNNPPPGAFQNPGPANQAPQLPPGFKAGMYVGATVAVLWALLVLIGGLMMHNLKSLAWARTGSIAAMVPCSICCIGGLPVGIWALVVLARPDVKRGFG
jgi:hypothetical protein